ncbi:acyltransferase family protein [Herbiconiux sp. P15]|uniref:acyltransferase family protein n=1 Tax=Herbiconiux liukaitaii TaxID=3342799 RepID=UPI0035BB42BB
MTTTTPTPSTAPGAAPARPRHDFRAEIQGLRALAVTLVVVYHLRPEALPGGYIGVDVFFVVSGFLISRHLFQEVRETGRIAVRAFWARRIRRLLPASFFVLAFTLVATLIWVPLSSRAQELWNIGGTAFYVINWVFSRDAVDYLSQDDAPSIVQQYWSLAVEEQLYVIWPLLLLALVFATRAVLRRRGEASWQRLRPVFAVALVVILVSSLAASIVLTSTSQGAAYFNTFVRAWEFAAGGLLALATIVLARRAPFSEAFQGSRVGRAVVEIAPWAGVVVIAACALLFTSSTPFPGIAAALPVIGTLLILAVDASRPTSLRIVSNLSPIRSVGKWSYSIYLWHWPLVVLFPLVFGREIGLLSGLALGVVAVLLGAFTSRFVEDPARFTKRWGARHRREFVFALVVPLALLAIILSQITAIDRSVAETGSAVSAQLDDECFGANAILDETNCPDALTVTEPVDVAFASADLDPEWCLTQLEEEWRSCTYGDPAGTNGTIALVGDSHAAALAPAFDTYYAERGWRVVSYFRFGCPALTTVPEHMLGKDPAEQAACTTWSARVLDELRSRDDIDAAIFTDYSRAYFATDDPAESAAYTAEVVANWTSIEATGKTVAFIQDVPWSGGGDIPACLSNIDLPALAPCSQPRSLALIDDPVLEAVRSMPSVRFIDTSRFFCTMETCLSYVGGAVVYADTNHLSGTYARSIAAHLGDQLLAALGAG